MANPCSWGARGLFYLMDRNHLSMCAVPRRMIFYSSLMLLAPGIFPKFWSIPSLISPSAPIITDTVSVLIPHIVVISISRSLYFKSFSMTFVEVFLLDGTDTSFYKFATLAGKVLYHYIRLIYWQFPISMYLHLPENCDLFVLGNCLRFMFIPPVWDFNIVMLARLPMNICSCLIVPL